MFCSSLAAHIDLNSISVVKVDTEKLNKAITYWIVRCISIASSSRSNRVSLRTNRIAQNVCEEKKKRKKKNFSFVFKFESIRRSFDSDFSASFFLRVLLLLFVSFHFVCIFDFVIRLICPGVRLLC